MHKCFIVISVLFCTTILFGQSNEVSSKALLIRGKASLFGHEDLYFHNWNLGVEYRFAKRHSIGIDFVHSRWRYEYDIYIDEIEQTYGPDSFSRRRYALLDYRYYPFKNVQLKGTKIDLYANPFVKLGERKIWTNDPGTFYSGDQIFGIRNHRSDFADYGVAFGFQVDFGEQDRFGFDTNIGAVYRKSEIRYEEKFDYKNDVFVERFSGASEAWKPHMRMNLYFRILKMD